MKRLIRVGVGAGATLVAVSSQAAIDISTVTGAVTDAATAIGTVGAAVLVMYIGGKVYKWIKSAV